MFQLKNTKQSYGLISQFFHWTMAVFVLGLLSLGYFMTGLEYSPDKITLYGLHKSFGFLILFLFFLRLIHKISQPIPAALSTHKNWEITLSKIIHISLYFCLLAMPLSGWLMSSAGDFPASFFGIEMFDLSAKDEELFKRMRIAHTILSYLLITCLSLHMAGAFKHHFIDKDQTLLRMIGLKKLRVFHPLFLVFTAISILSLSLPIYFIVNDKLTKSLSSLEATNLEQAKSSEEMKPVLPDGFSKSKSNIKTLDVKNFDFWNIEFENSSIAFKAEQYGEIFSGEFKEFSGDVIFDPENLSTNKVRILIDIASIHTGSDDRDKQALEKEWFDGDSFPYAVFESISFTKEDSKTNHYEVLANLTIKNKTKQVLMPFQLEIENLNQRSTAVMNATLSLNRLDFDVGQGEWATGSAIGTDIMLEIILKAHKN